MELQIQQSSGLRNDLLVRIPLAEIDGARLHITRRSELMAMPGLLRHVHPQDAQEREAVNACKATVPEHLAELSRRGVSILDDHGNPTRRFLVIGCRNVGNNHGFVAWQTDEQPRLFHVRGDPLNFAAYPCLCQRLDGTLQIRQVRFEGQRLLAGQTDLGDQVRWCVYGNPILRQGRVFNLEEIIDQFYDIRHVLALDRGQPAGARLLEAIYAGYPDNFREHALRALRENGAPRQRFLHNALGLSDEHLFILQREGTIEELATWLKEAGASDGLILDNGGSVFCWLSWLPPRGGCVFAAPDFRPQASAVLVLILNGSIRCALPPGSVSYAVV